MGMSIMIESLNFCLSNQYVGKEQYREADIVSGVGFLYHISEFLCEISLDVIPARTLI